MLARRAGYINFSISLCTIAALLVALVVVTLFANAFLGSELGIVIALLFVGRHGVPGRRVHRVLHRGTARGGDAAHRSAARLRARGPPGGPRRASRGLRRRPADESATLRTLFEPASEPRARPARRRRAARALAKP